METSKSYQDLYTEVIQVVQEITGVNIPDILTSNCEEHVDARHILVYTLGNRGFSDIKIAEIMNLSRPCVCMIRNNFKYRRKRYFVGLHYQKVYQRIFLRNEPVSNECQGSKVILD